MLSSVLSRNCIPKSAFNDGNIRVGQSTVDKTGWGLFARRNYAKNEIVCFFHGRHIKSSHLERLPPHIQNRYAKYMMALDDRHLCVPARKDGSIPMFPPSYSGCLINEASENNKPNVMTSIPESTKGLTVGCPIFGDNVQVFDWPVIAIRPIAKGAELLTCYGHAYGPRQYIVSKHCKACI